MSSGAPASPPGSPLRSLIRHTSIYSLAPILQRALSILLIPIYTKILSTGEYGLLELSDLLILLLPQLVGMNLLSGLTRFYFEQKEDSDRAAVVTSTTIALASAAWLAAGICLYFSEPLAQLLFAGNDPARMQASFKSYFILSVLIVPFSLTTRTGIQYLQTLKRSKTSTAILLSKTLFEAGLKLYTLFVLEWGIYGFLISVLVGEIVFSTALTGSILWNLKPRFSWRVFRPLWLYSLPLIPVGICQLGLHQLDRVLLKYMGPDTVVEVLDNGAVLTVADHWLGIYGLGYKIGFLLHGAIFAPFMQIWQPYIFGVQNAQERSHTMVRVGTYAMISLCAVYFPAILFGRQAVDILAGQETYREAWRVAPWIPLTYLFYACYAISQVSLFVAKRTWPLLWINLTALAINVALNLWLIPLFGDTGYVGAALATLGTFAFMGVAAALASRRLTELPFEPGKIVGILIGGLACVAAARSIDGWRDPAILSNLLLVIPLKLVALLAAGAWLWWAVLDKDGREGLLRLGGDVLKRRRGK